MSTDPDHTEPFVAMTPLAAGLNIVKPGAEAKWLTRKFKAV